MKNAIFLINLMLFLCTYQFTNAQTKPEADSIVAVADELIKNFENQKAITELTKSLEIYKSLDLKNDVKEILYKIGFIYAAKSGDWKNAGEYWNKALKVANELNDTTKVARIRGNLGIVYDKLGDYDKALKFHKQSLLFYERNKIHERVVASLINIGLLYINKSNYYYAKQNFDKALKLAKNNQYKLQVAQINSNIGLLNYKKGNYGKAYDYYQKSLKQFNDKISPIYKAELANNFGTIYAEYGDSAAAIKHYTEALVQSNEIGNMDLKARILNNLGNLFNRYDNFKQALNYFKESLIIRRNISYKLGEAITLNNIGVTYRKMKKYEKAKEFFKKSLDLKKTLGYLWGEAHLYLCYGDLYRETKEYNLSISNYKMGLDIANKIGDSDQYLFYSKIGKCELINGDTLAAIENYNKSFAIIEDIFYSIGLTDSRRSFAETVIPIYQEMVNLKVETGELEEALEYYERMRVRNLLDIIENGNIVLENYMTIEEIDTLTILESRLRSANNIINSYSTSSEHNMRGIDFLVGNRYELREQLKTFKLKLYSGKPDINRHLRSGKPLIYKDAVELLKKNEEAALIYMVQENKTTCFVLRGFEGKDFNLESYSIDITKKDLKTITEGIIDDWQVNSTDTLYKLLIKPVEDAIKGATQLCILADSYLNSVPFQTLVNPENNKYLIEDYAIYYVHSLTLLRDLRSSSTFGKASVLALGNPILENTNSNVDHLRNRKFAPLPKSADEVKSIGAIYKGKSKILLEQDASESNFKQDAKNYGIIHIASHGLFDEVNPMYSSILLSADTIEDGFLSANEVIKMKMNADLVVLSACETGKGKITEGEGLLGLSRAFFGATVPTVIGSLWQVDDNSTQLLMKSFHNNIKNASNYAHALQLAQINLIKNTKYKDPFFWAPFILIGDSD